MDWLPDLTATMLSIFGGMVMGWAMFRLLPGMKKDLYTPSEWMPVSLYLTSLGWFTYFVPQFIMNSDVNFWQQFWYGGIVFTVYMMSLILTLLFMQVKRGKR